MKEISKQGGPRAARRSDRRNAAAARRKNSKSRYALRRGITLVALAVCALLAGLFALDALIGGDEIHRGVSIGDVDVGGMTPEEARGAVERDAASTFEKISFGTGGEAFTLSGEELGVKPDAAAAVDEAYSVGRRGNVFQRISEVSRSYMGGVQVDLQAGYHEQAAGRALDRVAGEYNREPQNARLAFPKRSFTLCLLDVPRTKSYEVEGFLRHESSEKMEDLMPSGPEGGR